MSGSDGSGQPDAMTNEKRMKLRYAGTCRLCARSLEARVEAIYEKDTKTVKCIRCPEKVVGTSTVAERTKGRSISSPPLTMTGGSEIAGERQSGSGIAGASARREYERRKANDEAKLREKWGRFGGIAVALSDERRSTRAWAVGAAGEEQLGARLDGLRSDTIAVFHDRKIPQSRANIDHIVITPGRIWVVDAKRYQGRPYLRVEGGILRPRAEKLIVGRRDCTKLVDGVLKQVRLVQDLVGESIPVVGALCFVAADWPTFGGDFSTRGVNVVWPKKLAQLINKPRAQVLDVVEIRELVGLHFKEA